MVNIASSELPINADGSVYHLCIKKDDLVPYVILVGDPFRAGVVASRFDSIRAERKHREFRTIIGTYNGLDVMVIGTGIGVDNIEITLVEYHALHDVIEPKDNNKVNIIRVGTCGCPQEDVEVGTLAITQYALGFDNIHNYYKVEYTEEERAIISATANAFNGNINPYCVASDHSIVDALIDSANAMGYPYVKGVTLTAPGFYAPQGRIFGAIKPRFKDLIGIISSLRFHLNSETLRIENIEMESSAINLLCRMFGYRSATICAVLASRKKGSFIDSEGYKAAVERAIDTALMAIGKI